MHLDSSIYVAGHTGLIGSAILSALVTRGYRRVLTRTHADLDLTDSTAVETFFAEHAPEYVVLAAGLTGGIIANRDRPADLMTGNLSIQCNVMNAARKYCVQRLIFFGSSCMYPRECRQPMPESTLLSGPLEPTSQSYAIAKLAGIELCAAFNRQDGEQRFIALIPNSVYGPNDNFDLASSHVMAALIRRFVEAIENQAPSVTLWGSGSPRREFLFSQDLAELCLLLLKSETSLLSSPINVGCGEDISIRDLACHIAALVGYRGDIIWDTSKPDGAPRKLLDSSHLADWGWQPSPPLTEGLRKTIDWYRQLGKFSS